MSPSFFSSSAALSKATYFDIRLDDSYVVFRGNEQEAASAHLAGSLVLCLNEPLTIKHIKLSLVGMSRVSWHTSAPGPGSRRASRERTFYEKTWTFRDAGKGRTEVLPVDNYEYPFDLILDGNLPESVEGLHDSWITYRFKAEIGRKYAKDLTVRKPLRIIRTLDPSALELAHAMSVENVWPDKVEYAISTPSKAVIFGTSITVDFRLLPLLKGLKIGAITSQLIESHEFTLNPEDADLFHSTHKTTRIIAGDTHFISGLHGRRSRSHSQPRNSRGSRNSDEHGSTSEDEQDALQYLEDGMPGYCFTRVLELPKTLNKCMQDTDTRGIKIKHKLKFRIQLHNPDGHTSELRATLPVSIFISPNLPIDEHNTLSLAAIRNALPATANHASASDAIHAALSLQQQAPPLYGEHQFDQLYQEVDTTGYQTPGIVSGATTPFGVGTLSRNISMENLSGLPGMGYGMSGGMTGNISAAMLQHRLSNLHPHTNGNRSRAPSNPTLAPTPESMINSTSTPDSETPPSSSAVVDAAEPISIASPHNAASPNIILSRSPDQNSAPIAQNNATSYPVAPNGGMTTLTPTNGLSRRGSEEDCFSAAASGSVTPNPYFAEVEDLSRVPSYQTAVRSHARRRLSVGLPDYSEVVGQAPGPTSNGQTTNGNGNATTRVTVPTSNNTSGASSGTSTPISSPRQRFAAFRSSSHSALSTLGGSTGPTSSPAVTSTNINSYERASSGASTPTTSSSSNHISAERPAISGTSGIVNPSASGPGASHGRSHTWSWLHNHTHHHERYSGLLSHARHGGDHSAR